MTKRLRIGIDARLSVGSFRGMGRYTRELAAQCDEEVLWLGHAGQQDDPLVTHAAGTAFYPVWEQFVLPRLCRDLGLDAVLCPYNTGPLGDLGATRLFLVVHDLIYLEPRRSVPFGGSPYQVFGRIYRCAIVPRAVARAQAILTVSRFTAHEIERRLHVNDKPLVVVPNTIEEAWFDGSISSASRRDFVLTVSGEAPHKNLLRVIEAFQRARAAGVLPSNLRLLIAGVSASQSASVADSIRRLGVMGSTELLPYVSTGEMQELYRAAAFMVFPSLIEGFGIPVLEAMASGCPVIVSDRGALPEVSGDAALVVDPLSVEAIAGAMGRIWNDPALAGELASKGCRNAERFHPRAVRPQMRAAWKTLGSLCGSRR